MTVQDHGKIGSFYFSPDGSYFIHHTDRSLQLWTKDGVLMREFDTAGYGTISEPDFLPAGDAFLVVLSDGWDDPRLFRFALVRAFPDGQSCLGASRFYESPGPQNFAIAADGRHFAFSYKDAVYVCASASSDPLRT